MDMWFMHEFFFFFLGTYSDKHYLTNSSECQSCPRGRYCGFEGRTTWTGPCEAGFYCIGGASVKTPQDNTTGYRCPQGNTRKFGKIRHFGLQLIKLS